MCARLDQQVAKYLLQVIWNHRLWKVCSNYFIIVRLSTYKNSCRITLKFLHYFILVSVHNCVLSHPIRSTTLLSLLLFNVQGSAEESLELVGEEMNARRVEVELNDYPGSGANNRHTPRRGCADC